MTSHATIVDKTKSTKVVFKNPASNISDEKTVVEKTVQIPFASIKPVKQDTKQITQISRRRCKCGRVTPCYGYKTGNKGLDKATSCVECKDPQMVMVGFRMCIVCDRVQPCFGFANQKTPTHCVKHALEGMINIKDRMCEKCGVIHRIYGYTGQVAQYCKSCAMSIDPTMKNVRNKRCFCNKNFPSFGYPETRQRTHCGKCKLDGMIQLCMRLCSCGKTATFNLPGKKIPLYCGNCETPEMNDVRHTKCITCHKSAPSHGFPDKTGTVYCAKCAKKSPYSKVLVDKKHKMCVICHKIAPTYGHPDSNIPTHCKTCNDNAGLNYRDKKHKLCDNIERCDTRAEFGIPGNPPIKCTEHKTYGMIKNPRKKCVSCNKIGMYGIPRNGIVHCFDHKLPTEISFAELECRNCGSIDTLNNDRLCIICINIDQATDEQQKQITKQERIEIHILKLLTEHFGKPAIHNRMIEKVCGSEKPDIVYILGDLIIIYEIDENQHKSTNYCFSGEQTRMMNICNSYYDENYKVVFIRFNPHKFKTCTGDIGNIDSESRERILIQWHKYLVKNPPQYRFSVIYLFYDGYDNSMPEKKCILPINMDPQVINKEYPCTICDKVFRIRSVYNNHIQFCKNM